MSAGAGREMFSGSINQDEFILAPKISDFKINSE